MCLFTCIHTRAVHLEMSYGLYSGSFVKAYRRFIGRRGIPKVILLDNGSNFKGAIKELKNVEVSGYTIKEELKEDGIQWILNPPTSQHFGGIFEAMIKSAKKPLNVGNASLNDEELMSLFIEIEGMLYSRPLTSISKDIKDETVLTPSHFLSGQYLEGDLEELDQGKILRERWRRV